MRRAHELAEKHAGVRAYAVEVAKGDQHLTGAFEVLLELGTPPPDDDLTDLGSSPPDGAS